MISVYGCQKEVNVPSNQVTTLYGGRSAIDTVQLSNSVQVYRLSSPSFHVQLLAEYSMSAGPISIPEATAVKLRSILMDDTIYLWDVAKACGEPNYGIRFQFQRGQDNVDVLICFECDILGVYHNGQSVDYEDCDYGRAQLIAIAKELFPDDPAIQALQVTF
ncbi:MAG: hypothetical protein DWH91_12795 [Planctomycetota bacterium]|nr:MAG: hypothetical protein DWH91_12795 [Planctomycetota bacterium]